MDPAFGGGDGEATVAFGSGASAWGGALSPDGTIVLAGSSGPDLAVARLTSDGTPDSSFDGDGAVTTSVTPGGGDEAEGVTVQPDGKIVAVGSADLVSFLIVRYLPNGSLDPAFGGGDGIVTTNVGVGFDSAFDAAVQPNGKIVVVGSTGTTRPKFVVARYDEDGTLDPLFGNGDGITITPSGVWGQLRGVVLTPAGKIVAAGTNGGGFALARYRSNGTLDPTFGDQGTVASSVEPGTAEDVQLQPDGKIVAAGAFDYFRGQIARYMPNGKPDPSFGSDGTVTVKFGAGEQAFRGVAIQSNGRIVAGGYVGPHEFGDPTIPRMIAARFRTSGKLDATFGSAGKVNIPFPGGAFGSDAFLQPDGSFVVTGFSDQAATAGFAAARLLAS
jgi:uncharacterized delta-60 repeat protein